VDRLYSVTDVCRILGWPTRGKEYQRVFLACGTGKAGDCARVGRGYALTTANVKRLVKWLREKWPDESIAEEAREKVLTVGGDC
jgi:hypothetical protein